MIAFDVQIDGTKVASAGVEDWSILALHVNASRKERGSPNGCGDYIEFSVGGLTLPDSANVRHHFRWPSTALNVGSVVTVRIVEVAEAEVPAKRYRSDSIIQESPFTEEESRQLRYKDYLALKAEFESNGG